jgi:hypothetical protein
MAAKASSLTPNISVNMDLCKLGFALLAQAGYVNR